MKKEEIEKKQEEEIIERTPPPGEVVYEAVYREGEHELHRSNLQLTMSGLAAGLSMGFSMVGEAFLDVHLPDAEWTPLLTKLGYSAGFIIVILGRQQLFTKNTLTVVLPLLLNPSGAMLGRVARLWAIVLGMNLVGAFIFAWVASVTDAFVPEARAAFVEIAQHATAPGFGTLFVRGVFAGWLIALMVWLLPFAESARIWVIIILSYLIALAGLPHVIAGSVEALYLVMVGGMSFWNFAGSFLVPVLLGNIAGGIALVAVGAHAEFFEIEKKKKRR